MKAQREEGGGRILCGDNTDDGMVILGPMRFHCVGVWISAVHQCIEYTYIVDL
jgi:hypothetical protein